MAYHNGEALKAHTKGRRSKKGCPWTRHEGKWRSGGYICTRS